MFRLNPPLSRLVLVLAGLAAACGTGPVASTPVRIESFTATPSPVAAGGDVTVSWIVTGDVGAVELFRGATSLGRFKDKDSFVLEQIPEGPIELTLFATARTGPDQTAKLTLNAVSGPDVALFTADRTSVARGTGVTLRWKVAGADTMTITAGDTVVTSGEGRDATAGSVLVKPEDETTYTLTAQGVGGTITRTLTISMLAAPVIALAEATPMRVNTGESVTVRWQTEHADALTILADGRTTFVAPHDAVASGTRALVPGATGSLTLRAEGPGGETTRELQIEVVPSVRITSFSADRSDVLSSQAVTLSWTVEGATRVELTANGTPVDLEAPGASSGSVTTTPDTTTLYELTAIGPDGTVHASTTVQVYALPLITAFQSDRTQVFRRREPAILSWETRDGTAISIADSSGQLVDVGGRAVNADSVEVSPDRNTAYTLTLLGPGGVTRSAPVAITVSDPAPNVTLSLASPTVVKGETTTLVWTVTDHATMAISARTGTRPSVALNLAGHEVVPPPGSTIAHDSITLPVPDDTTTYTLTATGPGGTTVRAVTLTVTKVPTFTVLTSDHILHDPVTNTDSIVVTRGSAFDVTWVAEDADRVSFIEPPYSLSNEEFVDIEGLPGTRELAVNSWVQGASDDGAVTNVVFPDGFRFPFYGNTYGKTMLAVDGYICFESPGESGCAVAQSIRTNNQGTTGPSNLVAVFWDDLMLTASTKLLTRIDGTAPNRFVTLEWKDIDFMDAAARGAHLTFKVELYEDGRFAIWNAPRARPATNVGDNTRWGTSATIGTEPAFLLPMPWWGLAIGHNDQAATTLCHTFVPGTLVPETFGQCDPFTRAGSLPHGPASGTQTIYVRSDESVKLKATNAAGETVSKVLPVRVVDPVKVTTFAASRTHIGAGEQTQLSYVFGPSSNAIVSRRINDGTRDLPGVAGLSGSVAVTPTATTTYTCSVRNAAGDGEDKSVTVTVGAPTATFTADQTAGQPGDTFTLRWTTSGARSLVVRAPDGTALGTYSGTADQATMDQGALTRALTNPGAYRLEATNGSGTTTKTVTLSLPTGLSIPKFTATAVEQTEGENVTLRWEVLNGASVSIAVQGGDVLPGMPVTTPSQIRAGETTATVGATDTTWVLTATPVGGGAAQQAQVTVRAVTSARIASFTATPSSIQWGQETTLSWATTDATSVRLLALEGAGPTYPEIAAAANRASGSVTVRPATTMTYRLEATNRLGTVAQRAVTVSVAIPPPTIDLALTPATNVPNGGSFDVAWNATRADKVVLWQRDPPTAQHAADPVQIPYDYVPYGFVDVSGTGTPITSLVSPFNGNENLDSGYAIVNFPADFRPNFLGDDAGRMLVSAEGVLLLGPPAPPAPLTDTFTWDICKSAACVVPAAIGPTSATTAPSARLLPFWSNLIARNGCATSYLDCAMAGGRAAGRIYWQLLGTAPERVLVVQWDRWDANATNSVGVFTFEVKLYENGDSEFQYKTLDSQNVNFARGASAVVGIDKRSGPAGTNYFLALSNNQMTLNPGDGWRMYTGVRPASGHLRSFFNATAGTPPTIAFRGVATNAAPMNNRATALAQANVLAGVNEILISELLIDPVDGDDTGREWIELRNRRGTPVSLEGYTIQTSSGSYTFAGGLIPAATSSSDGYLVIGQSADPAVNGGVNVALAYGNGVAMDDRADTVILRYGNVLVDRVEYDTASEWSVPTGASIALDGGPAFANGPGNDVPIAWCRGRTAGGDKSSPGQANPLCNALEVIPYDPSLSIANDPGATTPTFTWALNGDRWGTIELPFAYNHFGTSHRTLSVSDNGFVSFGPLAIATSGAYSVNSSIPAAGAPADGLYPYWDDLEQKVGGSFTTKVLGTAPNRVVVVQWERYNPRLSPTAEMTFFVALRESGGFEFHYPNLGGQNGISATIGFEAMNDTFAVQYSFNQAVLPPAGVSGPFGLKYFRTP